MFFSFPEVLGKHILKNVRGLGRFSFLFLKAFQYLFAPPFRWKLFIKQLEFIGNKSLLVVLLTGCFTGMVLALQMYEAMRQFSAESVIGGVVGLALTKELGPVLTSLMVNARVGSAIAAEIGTMKVTDQISALESMAVNPVQYLITPRVFAGFVMLPLLTIIADFVGVLGGYVVAVPLLGLESGLYITKLEELVKVRDIIGGLVKAGAFGVILTTVGCYYGYYAKGGAEGVGNATTGAVVTSSVSILFMDYVITSFLIL